MFRTFRTATLLAMILVAACKKTDKPADPAPEATTKAVDPAKPSDPAAKPAEPAKPADPAASAAPAAPAKSPGVNSELETKGIAMMQKLADVFAADAKDCEKLATDIKAFVGQNKPLLGDLVKMEKTESEEQRAAFSTRNAAVQTAVAQKMQGAMVACAQNPSVLAAMKEFPSE